MEMIVAVCHLVPGGSMNRISKPIAELMRHERPRPMPATAMVSEAVALMRSEGWTSVLVTDAAGQLCGLLTEYDVLMRVIAADRDPSSTPLAAVMTEAPERLEPTDDIAYAINLMSTHPFRCVPVVDGSGRALSMLTCSDVMKHLSEILNEAMAPPHPMELTDWLDLGGG